MGWWNEQALLVRQAPVSKWALIAAGLLPVAGVLVLGWDLGIVMLAFWLENVVVGFYSILRMAFVSRWAAVFFVPFFSFHYGMFTFVHGIFVVLFFLDAPDGSFLNLGDALRERMGPLMLVIAALWISHGISFVSNFILSGRWREPGDPSKEMGAAYKRVIILHLVLVLGAVPMLVLGQPIWGLVMLVVLKIAVDLWSHAREHRPASAPAG